jgi:hypothetical protein
MDVNAFAAALHHSVMQRGFFETGTMPVEGVPPEALHAAICSALRHVAVLEAIVKRGDCSGVRPAEPDRTYPIETVDPSVVQQAIWNLVEAAEVLQHITRWGMRQADKLYEEVGDTVVTSNVLARLVGIQDVELVVLKKVENDEQRGRRHQGAGEGYTRADTERAVAACVTVSEGLPR